MYTDNLIKYKGSRPLNIISGSWQYNIHLNNCLILKPQIYGRILFDSDDVPFCYSNVIGGDWSGHYLDQQMPFAGIGNLEYGECFHTVGMKVQQRIEDNNYIMFTASLAAHGDKFHNMLNSFMHGYSSSYAYNSIFGPLVPVCPVMPVVKRIVFLYQSRFCILDDTYLIALFALVITLCGL